jgi:asparagine synthase (glutamine-hydrolysing)
MCGIAGAFAFDHIADPINRDVVIRLNDLQRRRGPDGGGLRCSADHRVVLGHRRLAIIDTGSAGVQPMSDASGRWVITFNGEIYNYLALRRELELLGRTFHSNSDTEVLINAIAQWGENGLRKLRGMYAFALWDSLEQELWLARDPYGIKPLYVAEHHGTMWFASQARSLSFCAPVNTNRDAAALVGFYMWGHVPEPFSWWAGIRMFPAGHVQRIRRGADPAKPVVFARIQDSYIREAPEPVSAGELRRVMLDSVQHHMVADVPIGVFLSAGIDSNVIAALASELGSKLRTVTLAFADYTGTPDDEAPLAEAAAKLLGSDHVTVRIDREEFNYIVDDFLKCMDQPTIDGLNTYLISRAAAQQGLKVALSGLGGDELFGGYPSFSQLPRFLNWRRHLAVPKSWKSTMEGQGLMKALLYSGLPPKIASMPFHSRDIATAYLLRRALHVEGELDLLLDESWITEGLERLSTWSALGECINTLRNAGTATYAQIAGLESCWYMRNQLLRDTDWSSMAHGLEVRVPFVDATVLDRLGPAIASKTPPGKHDLARCAERLPPAMLARPKTGFTTPVRKWITEESGSSARGLRAWAGQVHRSFRTAKQSVPQPLSAAA